MGKLTDTQLRAIKGTGKSQKLSDGEGLFLFVTPTGGTSWRIKYRFEGKEKLLCLGKYPHLSLALARKRLAETKEKLAQGIDPAQQKKAMKEAVRADNLNSFEVVAREWIEKHKSL